MEFISGQDLGKIDRGKIEEEINEGRKEKNRDTNEVETRQILHINLILRPVHITIVAVEKQ
jgi:hypothetical protein